MVASPITAVEAPRDRRRVASLLFRDCTAIVLRRHGGDGGATVVLVRCHGGHGGAAAIPLRNGQTSGGTADVLNMLTVCAVSPRSSAVLTVFRGATAINDGTTAGPLRDHDDHGGATAVYAVQAPQWHRASGVTGL